MDYFPETKPLKIGPLWFGAFRMFDKEPWKLVLEGKKRKAFSNATEALSAARAELKSRLNPKIRATEIAVKSVSDALGVEAWLRNKQSAEIAAKKLSKTAQREIRKAGKKTVVVESRRGKIR